MKKGGEDPAELSHQWFPPGRFKSESRARHRGRFATVNRASGLTLVEVLVVVAIIGLLVALLIPAVSMASEGARRASRANDLEQFGIAIQNCASQFSAFPRATTGVVGITFFPLITHSIDNGAASTFGARLDLGSPGGRIEQLSVDETTRISSDSIATVLASMPQFPFFNCPARGFRVSRGGGSVTTRFSLWKRCRFRRAGHPDAATMRSLDGRTE